MADAPRLSMITPRESSAVNMSAPPPLRYKNHRPLQRMSYLDDSKKSLVTPREAPAPAFTEPPPLKLKNHRPPLTQREGIGRHLGFDRQAEDVVRQSLVTPRDRQSNAVLKPLVPKKVQKRSRAQNTTGELTSRCPPTARVKKGALFDGNDKENLNTLNQDMKRSEKNKHDLFSPPKSISSNAVTAREVCDILKDYMKVYCEYTFCFYVPFEGHLCDPASFSGV